MEAWNLYDRVLAALTLLLSLIGIVGTLRGRRFATWPFAAAQAVIVVFLVGCWYLQSWLLSDHAQFWARLMAGQGSVLFGIRSLLLLAALWSCGLVVVSDQQAGLRMRLAALVLPIAVLGVILTHPTPSYVPVPSLVAKAGWTLGTIVGIGVLWLVAGRGESVLSKRMTSCLAWTATALLLLNLPLAELTRASATAELPAIDETTDGLVNAFESRGCLGCHTFREEGRPDDGDPYNGGPLDDTGFRGRRALASFLKAPTAENARKLEIRSDATGGMAGFQMTDAEADAFAAGLDRYSKELLAESPLGSGWRVLREQRCLRCHRFRNQGPLDGGRGGALDESHRRGRDLLRRWLEEPTAAMALELGISDNSRGAMEDTELTPEQIEALLDLFMAPSGDSER